jgi:uncharacterized protein (DUF983 family)
MLTKEMEHSKTRKKSPNLVHSAVTMRCPACRQGHLYKVKIPSNFNELADMNEHCEVCGQATQFEPGFYYGAMYVAYALTVAIFVTVWVAYTVLVGSVFDSVWTFITIDFLVTLLMMPVTFRLARSVWAHMFIKYKKENKEH